MSDEPIYQKDNSEIILTTYPQSGTKEYDQLIQDIREGKVIRDPDGKRWKQDIETGKNIHFCFGNDNFCNNKTDEHCVYCEKSYCNEHFLTHGCFEKYGLKIIYAIRDDIEGDAMYYTDSELLASKEIERLSKEDTSISYYKTREYLRTR